MLRTVTVTCDAEWCRCRGQPRQVHLRLIAMGVVELPRLLCAGCGCDMRQIAGWGGVAAGDEEAPCRGSSCSTSPERPSSTDETSKPAAPQRVPGTGRRSTPAKAGSSTARSAAGSGVGER